MAVDGDEDEEREEVDMGWKTFEVPEKKRKGKKKADGAVDVTVKKAEKEDPVVRLLIIYSYSCGVVIEHILYL